MKRLTIIIIVSRFFLQKAKFNLVQIVMDNKKGALSKQNTLLLLTQKSIYIIYNIFLF